MSERGRTTPYLLLRQMLDRRLEKDAREWFLERTKANGEHVEHTRFAKEFSLASRHARDRDLLVPDDEELEAADAAEPGWNPERWTMLEALRVGLFLSRPDLATADGVGVVEDLFAYADEGEQRALYRSLALLPEPERFAWRAGEGCRTNMTSVFSAVVLDTPFPRDHFDDVAFRQAALKAVFVGVPLWRLVGLDQRLDEELARMALDLADERRSAGRVVQPDLWLCLGAHGGERALAALEAELDPGNSHTLGRRAAAYGMARAGHQDRLRALLEHESDAEVRASMQDALDGNTTQAAFQNLQT